MCISLKNHAVSNGWNEWSGNAVSGVEGIGACYWVTALRLSGPTWYRDDFRKSFPVFSDYSGVTGDDKYKMYMFFNGRLARIRDASGDNLGNPVDHYAPLKKFSGNTCSTAAYAFFTTYNLDPNGVDKLRHFVPFPNPLGITRFTTNLEGYQGPTVNPSQNLQVINTQFPVNVHLACAHWIELSGRLEDSFFTYAFYRPCGIFSGNWN